MSEESAMSSSLRDITESTEAEGRDDTHQWYEAVPWPMSWASNDSRFHIGSVTPVAVGKRLRYRPSNVRTNASRTAAGRQAVPRAGSRPRPVWQTRTLECQAGGSRLPSTRPRPPGSSSEKGAGRGCERGSHRCMMRTRCTMCRVIMLARPA